jgi:hypothetical protein
MAMQPGFIDDPPPTQEELDQMFKPAMSAGELVVPSAQHAPGRSVGAELLITDVVTARRVEVARDEARILQKLATVAAYAGDEVLLYRWPVKNRRTGKTDTVEGPTVKAAYAIQRCYGNSRTDIASVDIGASWIFKAVFSDFEAGVQTARLFQQHKGVAKIGGDDDARRLDMAFQIGQSKAIRNAIIAHLELPFVNFLMDEARKNLVGRIGKNIAHYRGRIAQRLADIGVELHRVERQVGRPLADWLAPDLARVITEIKAVADGMASAAESWPVEAPPEPRRSDVIDESGAAAPAGDAPSPAASTAAATGPAATDSSTKEDKPSPPAADASADISRAMEPLHDDPPAVKNWSVGDVLGQDAIIKRVGELAAMATSLEDIDAIEEQNHDKVIKIVGMRGDTLRRQLRERRRELGGG